MGACAKGKEGGRMRGVWRREIEGVKRGVEGRMTFGQRLNKTGEKNRLFERVRKKGGLPEGPPKNGGSSKKRFLKGSLKGF